MDGLDTGPYSPEAEQALLGGLLANPKSYSIVAGVVSAEDFAFPGHGLIFQAIEDLAVGGRTVTAVTVHQALVGHPDYDAVGGQRALAGLLGSVVSMMGLADYAGVISDLARRRRMLATINEFLPALRAGDVETTTDSVMGAMLEAMAADRGSSSMIHVVDAHRQVVEDLKRDLVVYRTGLAKLDAAMGGGLQPGKLYVIAAKQKAGKTMLLTTISYNLAFNRTTPRQDPTPHAYVCLEMGAKEIHQRMVARYLQRNSLDFLRRHVRSDNNFILDVETAQDVFERQPTYFLDRPRMTLNELRQVVAREGLAGKIKGLIIDYAQLVSGQRRGQNGAEHLDAVAQTLVEAAKQWGIWIICAAQLNRDGEVRGGDGLLNAADQVYYLHRPDGDVGEDRKRQAWLAMRASRYTEWCNVGDENSPALEIDKYVGPHFAERLPPPPPPEDEFWNRR